MKSSKLLLTVTLAVCIMSMLFSACGNNLPAQETPSASEMVTPSAQETPSVSEPEEPSPVSVSPQVIPFTFTEENMPVIDGSTANIPLISAVQSVLLGTPRNDNVTVSGTDNAYVKLIEGEVDILLVYAPAQSSLDHARAMGVELEMAPIGKDALVFLVNKNNPVKSLTPEQIVGIYSGEITNWKDVGGRDAVIQAYQRQLVSGSQTMMNKLVMKSVPMTKAEPEYIIDTMGGLVEAIAAYDNAEDAIGYNVYYYVSRMKADDNIRLLAVNGVEPTNESIASGDYPFVNEFFAVIRADAPEGSPERILFDWIQSDEGQDLVENEGYVSIG